MDVPFDWKPSGGAKRPDGFLEELVILLREIDVDSHNEGKYDLTYWVSVLADVTVDLHNELSDIRDLARTSPDGAIAKLDSMLALPFGPILTDQQRAFLVAQHRAQVAEGSAEQKRACAALERAKSLGAASGRRQRRQQNL